MEVARLRQDSADGVYNGKRPVSSYVCSRNRQRVVGNSCIGYKTAFGEVRQIGVSNELRVSAKGLPSSTSTTFGASRSGNME